MLTFRQFGVGCHVVNIAVKLVQGFHFHRSTWLISAHPPTYYCGAGQNFTEFIIPYVQGVVLPRCQHKHMFVCVAGSLLRDAIDLNLIRDEAVFLFGRFLHEGKKRN